MSNRDVVRSWKDDEFRSTLSRSRQACLPPNPAGMVELNDEQLRGAVGGAGDAIKTLDLVCWLLSINICPLTN